MFPWIFGRFKGPAKVPFRIAAVFLCIGAVAGYFAGDLSGWGILIVFVGAILIWLLVGMIKEPPFSSYDEDD